MTPYLRSPVWTRCRRCAAIDRCQGTEHCSMFRRPVCGAQLRGKPGLRCQQSPMAGRRRCRLHGGKAGRPPGYPMHANTAFALRDGRPRWIARTRAVKEAEAAMPNDTLLAKTQRLLQTVMAKKNRRVRPAWLMTKV